MQLSGELAKVNLPNLLQLVKTGGFTGKLSISQGVRYAIILVRDGYPVHVELEGATGADALMELFLWTSGTFAFNEEKVDGSKVSLPENLNLSALIKDGILYVQQKTFLEELNVNPDTILKNTGTAVSTAKLLQGYKHINRLDGIKTLKEALAAERLSRREYVRTVAEWLENGLAEFVEPQSGQGNSLNLPTWVVSRLKQDNPDLTQAIVNMVIWVDRVKCWMYQTDAEFYETRKNLATIYNILSSEAFTAEAFQEIESTIETAHFASPQPPPLPPEETRSENTLQSRYDTIFSTSDLTGSARSSNPNQFRLSSSFIGGVGGRLSFLQKESTAQNPSLDSFGLNSRQRKKAEDGEEREH